MEANISKQNGRTAMIRLKNDNKLNLTMTKILSAIAMLYFITGIATLEELAKYTLSLNYIYALLITLYISSALYSLVFVTVIEGVKSHITLKHYRSFAILIAFIVIYEIIQKIFMLKFSLWNNLIMEYWWEKYTFPVKALSFYMITILGLVKIKIGQYWLSMFYNSNDDMYALGTFTFLKNKTAGTILSFPISMTGKKH